MYAETNMPTLDEFDLLTLTEVATLLHCSKAHVCKAVAGQVHCLGHIGAPSPEGPGLRRSD
jgi:hypothetical protein